MSGRTLGMEWELDVDRERALEIVTRFTGLTASAPRRARANPDGSRFMTWRAGGDAATPGWVVGGDPSLIRDGVPIPRCTEVSTPPVLRHEVDQWAPVLHGLRDAGARVTPRCALHVHVSSRGLRPIELARVAALEHDQHEVSAVRRRFAQPVPDAVLELAQRDDCDDADLWRAWYGVASVPLFGREHRHNSRRRVVNLHSVRYRGTIEFRWPAMTLDLDDMLAIVDRCLSVVQRATEMRS